MTETKPLTNSLLKAIRLSGSDRVEFLQGQLTHDIALLSPERPLLAGWASPKGRLMTTTWLCQQDDSILMIVPAALAERLAGRLKMFVLRSDVQIELDPVSIAPTGETNKNNTLSGISADSSYVISAGAGTALRLSADGQDGDWAAWRLACIRRGLGWVWSETYESFVPQMVNLDLLDGISFSKGCYVGQEIVARTQNLGRIKRRMYRFKTSGVVAPGQTITAEGKPVGEVVDAAAATGDADLELLAVMRIESLDAPLLTEDGAELERLDLPYEVPETI